MIILLPLKPMSVNVAWQGRRFKTKGHNQYCRDVALMLPKQQKISGYVEIRYKFYLKNWKMTDGDNLVKCLTDIIVKAGLIDDDRFIMKYVIEKFPGDDRIEIEIVEHEAKIGGTL